MAPAQSRAQDADFAAFDHTGARAGGRQGAGRRERPAGQAVEAAVFVVSQLAIPSSDGGTVGSGPLAALQLQGRTRAGVGFFSGISLPSGSA